MKILQINAVCNLGSTGRIAYEMAKEIEKYGHACYIAYSVSSNVHGHSKVYKIGNKFGRKLHALFSRITGKQGYFSSYATFKLIKYIEREKIELVHLGNLHANYINIKILLKFLAKKNIATVITLHDCWFYTGKCYHYSTEKCYKWMTQCEKCPKNYNDIPSWFFDFSRSMYRDKDKLFNANKKLAVVGVSDWITSEASKSLLKNAAIIKRIYNWIDIDVFKPAPTDKINELQNKYRLENKFVILSVASGWSDAKGLNKIIEISSMLSDDEVIVLAGVNASKEILPDNIISVGHIKTAQELAVWYSLADCYISMSLEESFGLTIAEAQACGTPVVVYNSTALPELVKDGCGYVVDADAAQQGFYGAIRRIREAGKSSFSTSCIENVKNNFNKQKNIKEYIDVYNEIICL